MAKTSALTEQFFEKALLAIKDRNYERAAALLVETIKLKPDYAEAWVVRGNVVHALGRYFDSLLHYDRALELNPKLHDGWCNRGIAFSDIGLWESAEECFKKSLELLPAVEPHMNLANMYCHTMRLDDAEREYRACLEIEPGNYDAHINLGITLLGMGKWKEGWLEYLWRHRNTPYPPRSARYFNRWLGEDLKGKTIILYPEQGFGDEILFMRYASVLKEHGAGKVILEARAPLLRLAKTVQGVDEVVLYNDIPPLGIDLSCALMDVPMFLGHDKPCKFRYPVYLKPPLPDQRRFPSLRGNDFKVGLCWSAGQRPLQPETAATAAMKSIHLEWLKVLAMPGVQLVSLQKEHNDDKLVKELGMIDHMGGVQDFSDTAEIIAPLNLVISVDTAVAHLAGAMGKLVWNLTRFNAYWPWGMAVTETDWYGSMRLMRQPQIADWGTPIKLAVNSLRELVDRKKAA